MHVFINPYYICTYLNIQLGVKWMVFGVPMNTNPKTRTIFSTAFWCQACQIRIQSAGCAFAALLANGNVVTWGDPAFGGDSGHVQVQLQQVQQIYSTYYAFAALLSDQSVVTWGDPAFGGDCTEVQSQLRHVQTISGTVGAFVAICADGLMLSWGNVTCRLKGLHRFFFDCPRHP